MNTIVHEMNPAGEIELTDAQLGAVSGACDNNWHPVVCEDEEEEFRWHHKQQHCFTVVKKVVFFEQDCFVKREDEDCDRW